jgi:polyhydroxyalkanoate synthesis regulator protein
MCLSEQTILFSKENKMEVDTLAAMQLLSNLFRFITDQLNMISNTPKRKFAKEIIALFHILKNAEKGSSGVIESLNDFNKEETIGMKVHYISKAYGKLELFLQACVSLISWIDKHENISSALQFFVPDTSLMSEDFNEVYKDFVAIQDSNQLDIKHTKWIIACVMVINGIDMLEDRLEAKRSPNPKGFPVSSFVTESIEAFSQMKLRIQESERILREQASAWLSLKLPITITEYEYLDVLEIEHCPKCKKSHLYQLNVEQTDIMYEGGLIEITDRSKREYFTRLFTCPTTGQDFQAKFWLIGSIDYVTNVVSVIGL